MGTCIYRHLSFEDLVFDLTLILMFFFLRFLSPDQGIIINSMNPAAANVILSVSIFFAPWYLADIYSRYKSTGRENKIYNIASYPVLICGIITTVMICYIAPYLLIDYRKDGTYYPFVLFSFIGGTLAAILGWTYGSKADENRSKITVSGIHTFFIPMLIIVASSGLFLAILNYMSHNESFPILFLLCSIVAVCLILKYLKQIFSFTIIKTYLFPFMLVFSLEIFFEILSDISSDDINVLYLVIGGIIPTRILLLFAPRIRIINFVVGMTTLVIAVYLSYGTKFQQGF